MVSSSHIVSATPSSSERLLLQSGISPTEDIPPQPSAVKILPAAAYELFQYWCLSQNAVLQEQVPPVWVPLEQPCPIEFPRQALSANLL